MEPTRFDLTARRVARQDAAAFFGWLLTGFDQHLRFVSWLDPRSSPEQSVAEVTGDTVARLESVTAVSAPWMFPVEFQTSPDPGMFGRLQRQIGQWWEDLRPDDLPDSRYQVACAVVNLTGTKKSAPASRTYRFPLHQLTWGGKVRERFLADESADKTLGQVEREELRRGILPLIVLMHGADKPAIISRWIAQANRETDSRRRADLGSMTLTLAAIVPWFGLWKDALKEWNMVESQFVLDLQAEATLKANRDNLKEVLSERFGELPADVVQRIDALTDANQVRQLHRAAVRVKRLDEFPV